MSKKTKTNDKIKFLIFFIIIAVIAAVPTIFKKANDISFWNENAQKADIIENGDFLNYEVNFHFIDVGQGSCTLITSDYGNILVDCGEKENYEHVTDYLENLKIKKIDYLIASHPHSDHIGCMYYIVNKFDIGKFFMPEIDESDIPTSVCYERLLESLDKKNVDSSYMKKGDAFQLGEVECTALAPVEIIKGNLNSMSIILKVKYKDISLLLTGDAETDEEKTVLKSGSDISADILSIAHHGSRTSSSMTFLKAVSPQIAVISCAENNKYNHPHTETLDKLKKLGIEIYRTDIESDIIISTDGEKIVKQQTGDIDE